MFPEGDITRMQVAQQAHMPDTCHRSAYSSSTNNYGEVVPAWTENTTDIVCGIQQGSGRISEQIQDDKTVVTYDAIARLPISQAEVWNIKDKFILTKRFGVAITPITYDVAAPIQRGPSGIRLILKKVEV